MTMICPKCGHQRNVNDDPTIPDSQCPACGIYYIKYINRKSRVTRPNGYPKIEPKLRVKIAIYIEKCKKWFKNALDKFQSHQDQPITGQSETINDNQRLLAYAEADRHKANHLLHLLLSLVTFGLWLIVWFIANASNTAERNKIFRKNGLPTENNIGGLFIQFCMILLVISFFTRLFNNSPKTAQIPIQTEIHTKATSEKKPQKTPEQIAEENAACKLNLQCWGDRHISSPGFMCKKYIEKLAKYSFEWTDGIFETKFSKFKWKNQNLGYLTYVGDKIKFQNGFGAWQNMIYSCDIDPETGKVMGVLALPGRL